MLVLEGGHGISLRTCRSTCINISSQDYVVLSTTLRKSVGILKKLLHMQVHHAARGLGLIEPTGPETLGSFACPECGDRHPVGRLGVLRNADDQIAMRFRQYVVNGLCIACARGMNDALLVQHKEGGLKRVRLQRQPDGSALVTDRAESWADERYVQVSARSHFFEQFSLPNNHSTGTTIDFFSISKKSAQK